MVEKCFNKKMEIKKVTKGTSLLFDIESIDKERNAGILNCSLDSSFRNSIKGGLDSIDKML